MGDASEPKEVPLSGGGGAPVARVGGTVRRSTGPWSPAVHALLAHLERSGFVGAPRLLGVDDRGREVLDFIAGEAGNYPLSEAVQSDQALTSAGRLLASYHRAARADKALPRGGWRFPAVEPVEVICHNDFAPYNVVFDGEQAVGLIDFDTAVPGPVGWDLAYALYRFAPLTEAAPPALLAPEVQVARAGRFLDAYGLVDSDARIQALRLVPVRLQALIDYMTNAAGEGELPAQHALAERHDSQYVADIAYVTAQTPAWEETLAA